MVLVVRYGAKYYAPRRLRPLAAEARRLYRFRSHIGEVMKVCKDALTLFLPPGAAQPGGVTPVWRVSSLRLGCSRSSAFDYGIEAHGKRGFAPCHMLVCSSDSRQKEDPVMGFCQIPRHLGLMA
jgi:hypothetical protein